MSQHKVNKGWGYEIIFANTSLYCGKILHFNAGKKSSMHFHAKKTETFYIHNGEFIIRKINTNNAEKKEIKLTAGMSLEIPLFTPHQIEAITEGDIFEASTHDDPLDSYRVEKGASQEEIQQTINPKNPIYTEKFQIPDYVFRN